MNELAKLKDIKAPVHIDTFWQEAAIYAGAGLGLLMLGLLIALLYLFIFKKKRRKLTKRELALNALKNINYSDTKNAVYTFSINAQKLIDKEHKDELEHLLKDLEKYKYKKEVTALEPGDIERMKEMIKKLRA